MTFCTILPLFSTLVSDAVYVFFFIFVVPHLPRLLRRRRQEAAEARFRTLSFGRKTRPSGLPNKKDECSPNPWSVFVP